MDDISRRYGLSSRQFICAKVISGTLAYGMISRFHKPEALLKTKLDEKLAQFKKECFNNTILKAYEDDGQQTHTIEWYARELPHLNLSSGYSDRHEGIERNSISTQDMVRRFIEGYTETVKPFFKDLFAFGPKGNEEIRDLVTDFMKGILIREARNSHTYLSKKEATALSAQLIWDEDRNYAVREGFLGAISYAFDYFTFDPTGKRFNMKQTNGKSFSENLDLIASKLNQLY